MAFNLLIDYDNLNASDQTKGLIYIAENILSQLSPSEVSDKNVLVRLYGGWYENNKITRKAENLKADILRDFPRPALLSDSKTSVIVNTELATSLTIQPTLFLANTYRRNGIPSGLKAYHPIRNGCKRTSCPVLHVYNFVQAGICGECNTATVEDIFYRSEQKLVDTMLTSDMILIAQQEKKYGIVSSDDDFWPGILTSITIGSTVYHFQTQRGRTTPPHYSRTVNHNYYMKSL
ncbi:hypothetical protein MTO98_25945 [Mucilaginibacter sp. SMC90]|uniref:hypothetical protein n=1 Tax=Mucilaginibacter sp. SMC90 TaxID=2929803 RepID=UPI001FB37F36|nr:hypothetical protein [Mucilaginibacter sp. SMC90]UOE47857.1 hypothetical protein MTO98_25945 [Mucilaginibacter sp. SMC90]